VVAQDVVCLFTHFAELIVRGFLFARGEWCGLLPS